MALKDLVADRSKLTEEAIEKIVRDYVRYDPGSCDVVLTPAGMALGNDAKILVLLVAIAGWPYVVEEVPSIDTKPAALEQMTGIPGGTLRPILKRLKDSHLVVSTSDGYVVRVANLDAIGRVVAGERVVEKSAGRRPRPPTKGEDDRGTGSAGSPAESRRSKEHRKARVPVRASLSRLVDDGFFSNERTLGEVVARLHEMAIIVKTTSLSGPVAEMVRSGKLVRKKVTEGGKGVWSYRAANHA